MKEKKLEQEVKKIISPLSLILLLSLSLMAPLIQPSSAQVGIPQPVKTVGYITVAPQLVGVDQEATVNLWVFPMPTTYAYKPYFNGFYGVTVTFVKPDGTKDTFMPVDGTGQYIAGQASSLGSIFTFYAPDMAGDWSVSFTMPAQNITDSSGTVLYAGCTSNSFDFTVQTEPVLAGLINGYPWVEFPDDDVYWSYPVNVNNRDWSQISGDWTGVTSTMATVNSPTQLRWQPYGTGPRTSHIVWSQPVRPGGIIGGAYGSLSYATQGSGTLVNPSVIMQGKVFQNILYGAAGNARTLGAPNGQFQCFDLTTGNLLYTADGSISYGIHLPGNAYAQAASAAAINQTVPLLDSSYGNDYTSYLFGTTTTAYTTQTAVAGGTYWNYYDPFTGKLMLQYGNAQAAQLVDGTPLAFGASNGYVYRWNMTNVKNNNWLTGVTWNVSLPEPLTTAGGANAAPTTQKIFAVSQDCSTIVVYNYAQYWGYNAETGALLWSRTLDYPVNTNEEIPLAGVDAFLVWDPTAAALKCYSMITGSLLWATPSVASAPWATTWTVYWSETNDLNNLYVSYPDGCVRAYSLDDGHLLWTSTAIPTTEHTENAFPLVNAQLTLVGGYLYAYAGYSLGYQINPIPRFSMMLCINATTGDTEWILNGGVCPNAASSGYLIGQSIFDGNLYGIGKGKTSTSVTIQNDVVSNHATVLIKGNVLDQSPASEGTPAVADSSMSEWMDYLHMQNATLLNNPPKPEGVPVTLTAVDPNGNTITIGTTTTNSEGNYAIKFAPENVGTYAITASFAGTASYWPSDSQAMMEVIAAPETSPTPTAIANPPYELYTIGAAVAVIIAIAVAVLLLRKKP